ncbi:cell division protein ZipA C-terminal FtsZ-binding domain-containing protein [Ferrovum myxofaciens]|jgi:hypothetical protein|uniref:Cell division protein ZipA n=2 Tax=root TaxID=1 RepID=A0A149VZH4_9PROT|nr:cell division protein ZipA C-terminal FtsZ-binding domain-containing protein [Ferrovum myxofaciens]KXW58588.1 hypothetical protein FEMY_09870 [Ferrovum myxofaciens]MBW8028261.1 hypothetical protein [Ferrovum sp.]QKE41028.1 MAG: hypothetical protein HO274_06695 [Ferrovum myxofaciens]
MMSELRIMAGVSALALVVGVVLWGRWQEQRQQRLTRDLIPTSVHDPLLDEVSEIAVREEPKLGEIPVSTDQGSTSLAQAPDLRFEYDVVLRGHFTGNDLRQAIHRSRLMTQGLRWVGQHQGQWMDVTTQGGVNFEQCHGLLPLVSRAGRISEARLTLFADEMRALASHLGATIEPGEVGQAAERAQQLDRFCEQVDIIVGINVRFSPIKSPLGSRLLKYLTQEGISLGEDGGCHARTADGQDRFTLIRQDGAPFLPVNLDHEPISAVTLLLEVVRVPDPVTIFKEMFAVAERLALVLEGEVVDDQGERLGVRQCTTIEKQLAQVMGTLETQGIPCGSTLARRFFS